MVSCFVPAQNTEYVVCFRYLIQSLFEFLLISHRYYSPHNNQVKKHKDYDKVWNLKIPDQEGNQRHKPDQFERKLLVFTSYNVIVCVFNIEWNLVDSHQQTLDGLCRYVLFFLSGMIGFQGWLLGGWGLRGCRIFILMCCHEKKVNSSAQTQKERAVEETEGDNWIV